MADEVDGRESPLSLWFPSVLQAPTEEVFVLVSPSQIFTGLRPCFRAVFDDDQLRFQSAGQLVVFCKALCFGDQEGAVAILNSGSPFAQSELAGKIGRDEAGGEWDLVWQGVVSQANRWKFASDEDLKQGLVSTHGRLSVWSRLDEGWKAGIYRSDPRTGVGCLRGRRLGKVLEEVRKGLKRGDI